MNCEVILPQLSAHFIQLTELVKSKVSQCVYKGTFQGFAATIEIQQLQKPASQTHLGTVFPALHNLSHPNILLLYDYFEAYSESAYYFVVVSEWYPKDLEKDIMNRLINNFRWKEVELWGIVGKLIEAFARLECLEIAHRNIKPANIYLSEHHEPKVGGFWSATYGIGIWTKVVGTLKYLSPALGNIHSQKGGLAHHNAFRADVYSLGVTLYEMTSLDTETALQNAASLRAEVSKIPFSEELKNLLRAMLTVDEEQRPDFVTLHNWISPSSPLVAGQPQSTIQCMHCLNAVLLSSAVAMGLQCHPSSYVFCSGQCFAAWCPTMTFSPAYCSVCGAQASQPYNQGGCEVAQGGLNPGAIEIEQIHWEAAPVRGGEEMAFHQSRENGQEAQHNKPEQNQSMWRRLCRCCFTSTK